MDSRIDSVVLLSTDSKLVSFSLIDSIRVPEGPVDCSTSVASITRVVIVVVQSLEEASFSLFGSIGRSVVIILGEEEDSNSDESCLSDSVGSIIA